MVRVPGFSHNQVASREDEGLSYSLQLQLETAFRATYFNQRGETDDEGPIHVSQHPGFPSLRLYMSSRQYATSEMTLVEDTSSWRIETGRRSLRRRHA